MNRVRTLAALGLLSWLASCSSDGAPSEGERAAEPDAAQLGEDLPDASTPDNQTRDAGEALDADMVGQEASVLDASSGDASEPAQDGSVGQSEDYAAALKTKLVECALLSGSAPVQLDNPRSPEAVCALLCLANAGCAQLSAQLCGGATGALKACLDGCAFTCASGAPLPLQLARCDGVTDCGDGSDEADCDDYYFTCDDGMQINTAQRCDGVRNCADYSDEAACENPFVCGGTLLPPTAVCDLVRDCSDGSDEASCAIACAK